jgi:DNA-binding transcriptional LysR family regulator
MPDLKLATEPGPLFLGDHLSKVSGSLRLAAPPSISDSLIAPIAVAFQKEYPDVHIQVFITEGIVDQIAEGVDLAFRVGRSAVFAARDRGAVVIAVVMKKQLDNVRSLGADRLLALDDPAAFADLQPVDVVANTVRRKTAEDLLAKVKPGGTFASVTGAPHGRSRV